MHYIRFLKPPKIEIKKKIVTVKALVTIATDLGDSFLGVDANVFSLILKDDTIISKREFQWRSGMRALPVEHTNIAPAFLKSPVRMLISTESDVKASVLSLSVRSLPEIVNVWSEPFTLNDNGHRGGFERRLRTPSTSTVPIGEDPGESIARHLWDGGIALCAVLWDFSSNANSATFTPSTSTQLKSILSSKSTILELGSGSGLVGIHLALISPKSTITLTDLPEATDILDQNISRANLPSGTSIESCALDWAQDLLPASIAAKKFDLIVVSDCTYNTDSIPSLVRTVAALLDKSPSALLVIATKVRHDSEAVFHKHLAVAAIEEIEHQAYEIPDRQRQAFGLDLEVVDVYVYRRKAESAAKE